MRTLLLAAALAGAGPAWAVTEWVRGEVAHDSELIVQAIEAQR